MAAVELQVKKLDGAYKVMKTGKSVRPFAFVRQEEAVAINVKASREMLLPLLYLPVQIYRVKIQPARIDRVLREDGEKSHCVYMLLIS